MTAPASPEPALFGIACLAGPSAPIEEARREIENLRGPLAQSSATHPFDITDYYIPEMGTGLERTLWVLENPAPVESLPDLKHHCAAIETSLRHPGRGRRVNLDPFYLDHRKVVLASFKGAGHKIYLTRGVWADLTLRFHRGRWQFFEWSFPDFRDDRYHPFLTQVRERYLAALRAARP